MFEKLCNFSKIQSAAVGMAPVSNHLSGTVFVRGKAARASAGVLLAESLLLSLSAHGSRQHQGISARGNSLAQEVFLRASPASCDALDRSRTWAGSDRISKLIDATVHDASVRAALEQLIAAKRSGAELDRGPRIPVISDFITSELTHLENTASDRADPAPQVERLNEVFRSTLKEVWQSQHGVECENRALNIY
jgi:hypothetical protein